ncbi:MAG: hypothetical protein WD069_14885 [Planctomycetales bacterium]
MAEQVPSLAEFIGLPTSEVEQYDIALLNLCAARGLPGTENLDIPELLDRLDEWAQRVRIEICRHLYRFDPFAAREPTEYSCGNSLGRFFCWYTLQVLQEDCGVAYHPDRKFKPDFCKPEDVFIHGIVSPDGQGGTCASMPVVYVAVGRRLGLPVHLAATRGHLYFRWDDPRGTTIQWRLPDLDLWIAPDRFNIEGSGEGIAFHPDSHYIQWPELWTKEDCEYGRYLRSLTAKEELASFLMERGECFWDLGKRGEALKAFYYACKLVPDDKRYERHHALRTRDYEEHERKFHERFREQERERFERQARRRALPGVWGHSPNCCCGPCEHARDIAETRPQPPHGSASCTCWECTKARAALSRLAPPHGKWCLCPECREARGELAPPGPPHPDCCTCWNCQEARKAAEQPPSVPGHPPNCRCAGCAAYRVTHQPMHALMSAKPSRSLPGIRFPHQTAIAHPGVPSLPGF